MKPQSAFTRQFTDERRKQGFRSQPHLDAFYASHDHAALSAERDEAVALLRRMVGTYDFVVIGGRCAVCNNDRTRFHSIDCQNCESTAFLSRIDAGKDGAR